MDPPSRALGVQPGRVQACLEISPAVQSGSTRPVVGVAPAPAPAPAPAGPPAGPERDGKFHARRVDKFSRKSFPLIFFAFNMAYWIFPPQFPPRTGTFLQHRKQFTGSSTSTDFPGGPAAQRRLGSGQPPPSVKSLQADGAFSRS